MLWILAVVGSVASFGILKWIHKDTSPDIGVIGLSALWNIILMGCCPTMGLWMFAGILFLRFAARKGLIIRWARAFKEFFQIRPKMPTWKLILSIFAWIYSAPGIMIFELLAQFF